MQIPQNLDGSWEALRHSICILITKLPTIGGEIGETIHADGISFISNRRVEKRASGSGFSVLAVVVVVVTGRCP